MSILQVNANIADIVKSAAQCINASIKMIHILSDIYNERGNTDRSNNRINMGAYHAK